MTTLVITDIPRIAALAERIAAERDDLLVVGEIYRGIEELERFRPELIIIQNYLSGLSADIVHKHLRSRLHRPKTCFALISPGEGLDARLASQFVAILDPTLADDQFEQQLVALLDRVEGTPDQPIAPPKDQPSPAAVPASPDQTPYGGEPSRTATTTEQVSLRPAALPEPAGTEQTEGPSEEPITYGPLRRPSSTVISPFSQQLDSSAEELDLQPASVIDQRMALPLADQHQELPSYPDTSDTASPLFRRSSLWVLFGTLALVVVITLIQQRTPAPRVAPMPPAPASKPPLPTPATPAGTPAATGHQPQPQGRLTALPSFIPQSGINPGYAKDNPGWESYTGQAYEYRVFRAKGRTIKAIQVIDRSGGGIQEAFYAGVLKELSGTSAIRTTSAEIKEGYEIRRGTVDGLNLVQYRDARGGRLRGFVLTWP